MRSGRFHRDIAYILGALIAVGLVASAAFWPGGIPMTALALLLLGIANLGYLIWRLATGRDGLIRRGSTRRRLARLERQSSAAPHPGQDRPKPAQNKR